MGRQLNGVDDPQLANPETRVKRRLAAGVVVSDKLAISTTSSTFAPVSLQRPLARG
jgi:hypothetical protein